MARRSKKHARRSDAAEVWHPGEPGIARERWKHRAGRGGTRAAAESSVPPPAHDRRPLGPGAIPDDGETEALVDARGEVVAAITSFAESALHARERAERDAQRIREAADAYAEAKRAEAERVLEAAIHEAAMRTGATETPGLR